MAKKTKGIKDYYNIAADKIKNDFLTRNIVIAISIFIILIVLFQIFLALITRHGQKYDVPNFSGMTISDAQTVASKYNLRLEVIDSLYVPSQPKGVILEQYPKAGNSVKSKRRIFLTTNTFNPKMVPMPYVTGFSLRQAKNKLTGAGFTIAELIYKSDLATNNILEQRYMGKSVSRGSKIMGEVGSAVTLVVGLNPVNPDPIVPNVVGLSINEAKNRLWEAGFNVGNVELGKNIDYSNQDEAKIYWQSINKNASAMHGRTIHLKATIDRKLLESGKVIAEKEGAENKRIEAELATQMVDSLEEQNTQEKTTVDEGL